MREHIEDYSEYLYNTLYDTDKLVVELPKSSWYKINPTRGIKKSKQQIDLHKQNIELSNFFQDLYGITTYSPMLVEDNIMNFFRRNVACGGALYPNNIYILSKVDKTIHIYQYNPRFHTLNKLKSFKDSKSIISDKEQLIVVTSFYWKNWPKYNYFGYRLMLVDSGYVLCNASILLSNRGINHTILLDNELNKKLINMLDYDISFENVIACIKTKYDVLENLVDIADYHNYKKFDDWDSEKIELYSNLEQKLLEFDINIMQPVSLNKIKALRPSERLLRISPGGGALITNKDMCGVKLGRLIKEYRKILKRYEEFTNGTSVYLLLNKVEGLQKGLYKISEEKLIFLYSINIDNLQQIMKKNNFNLKEVQGIIFLGHKIELKDDIKNLFNYKFAQIKTGFCSQLLSLTSNQLGFWNHPILGYNLEKLEKIIKFEEKLLNMIIISEAFEMDTFSTQMFEGEL